MKTLPDYCITSDGILRQQNYAIREYNKDYVIQSYDKYGDKVSKISHLRLGYLLGAIKQIPNSILDVGYGNGDFLNTCHKIIPNCYGNDISSYPVPKGCKFVKNILDKEYDVVCFFDVLEHFEDIEIIKKIKTKYLYISLPWCHNFSPKWLLSWKHLRPNEHLWHFNEKSLIKFCNRMGYKLICSSNIEDIVRSTDKPYKNILSCIFKK